MNDGGWRTRLRWVVVHPHDPSVLAVRGDGALVLPGVAQLQPPIDRHTAQPTAWWLRQVLAGLA
jgi:hypothetical protein